MKAIVCTEYGAPDVLKLEEIRNQPQATMSSTRNTQHTNTAEYGGVCS